MRQKGPGQLEELLRDPAGAFASPEEVLSDDSLTLEQKVKILKVWENDAAEAEVATEEGMPGSSAGLLRPILLALQRLDVEGIRTDPSKQHALV